MRNPSLFDHTCCLRLYVKSSVTQPTCLYTRSSHSAQPCLYSGQRLSMQHRVSSCHLDSHRHGLLSLTSSRVSGCRRPSQLTWSGHREQAHVSLISLGHPEHPSIWVLMEALALLCPCHVIYGYRTRKRVSVATSDMRVGA